MLHIYAGAIVIAKAYLQLLKQPRFDGSKKDTMRFEDPFPSLVEAKAKLVLSSVLHKAGSKESVVASKAFVK